MSWPCRWDECMKPALEGMPVCYGHAMEIWRNIERRGMATSHRPQLNPSQYSEMAGHPVVYYIETRPGVVKIGTTADLPRRVATLRLDMSDVLAAEPGGYPKERFRHAQFAEIRIGRREDFRRSADLDEHIATLRATFGEPAEVARQQNESNRAMLA